MYVRSNVYFVGVHFKLHIQKLILYTNICTHPKITHFGCNSSTISNCSYELLIKSVNINIFLEIYLGVLYTTPLLIHWSYIFLAQTKWYLNTTGFLYDMDNFLEIPHDSLQVWKSISYQIIYAKFVD